MKNANNATSATIPRIQGNNSAHSDADKRSMLSYSLKRRTSFKNVNPRANRISGSATQKSPLLTSFS